jgi:hypothetical protein
VATGEGCLVGNPAQGTRFECPRYRHSYFILEGTQMAIITMDQAIIESGEGFSPRFYDPMYGDRMPVDLANGVLVYARTPFEDLNGTPVKDSDPVRHLVGSAQIESGRPSPKVTGLVSPFMFFEEL